MGPQPRPRMNAAEDLRVQYRRRGESHTITCENGRCNDAEVAACRLGSERGQRDQARRAGCHAPCMDEAMGSRPGSTRSSSSCNTESQERSPSRRARGTETAYAASTIAVAESRARDTGSSPIASASFANRAGCPACRGSMDGQGLRAAPRAGRPWATVRPYEALAVLCPGGPPSAASSSKIRSRACNRRTRAGGK